MGVVLSKESFVKAINDIKEVDSLWSKVNSIFRENGADGYLFPPDCTLTVMHLLHEVFGDCDKNEWIDYYVSELDFGRKYCPDVIRDENGEAIKLDTAEALYDFLVAQEDRGE